MDLSRRKGKKNMHPRKTSVSQKPSLSDINQLTVIRSMNGLNLFQSGMTMTTTQQAISFFDWTKADTGITLTDFSPCQQRRGREEGTGQARRGK